MSKLVKDETKRLINVIQEQIENLLAYDNQIPIIEIDLTKESIRKLYQQLDYLAKPLDKNVELEKIIRKTNRETEDLLDVAEKEFENPENKIEEAEEVDKIENEIEELESKVEKIDEVNKEKSSFAKDSKDKVESENKPKPKIDQKSIIDVVASEEETNIGDRFQETNISSLKSAIGINDKFQFINELFEGSMTNYNKFIKELDSKNSNSEAMTELSKAESDNKWTKENSAYQLLENYISRRFID